MNKNIKTTIPFLLGAALLGACSAPSDANGTAQSAPSSLAAPPNPAGARAASDVLLRVRDVVATGRVSGIGFSSPEEVDGATIGEAIPVYYLSSGDVVGRSGADPHAILGKPQEMVYPILVNGVVRSQVKMGQQPSGEWVVTGVGGPETIQAIDQARRGLAIRGSTPAVALVHVHDLKVSLLAHDETGELAFTPFAERSAGGLGVGTRVPAETAFRRITELRRARRAQ